MALQFAHSFDQESHTLNLAISLSGGATVMTWNYRLTAADLTTVVDAASAKTFVAGKFAAMVVLIGSQPTGPTGQQGGPIAAADVNTALAGQGSLIVVT